MRQGLLSSFTRFMCSGVSRSGREIVQHSKAVRNKGSQGAPLHEMLLCPASLHPGKGSTALAGKEPSDMANTGPWSPYPSPTPRRRSRGLQGTEKCKGLPVGGGRVCSPSWAVYSLSMILAKPKSAILQPRLSDTRMLAARRSRWMEFMRSM